MRSLGPRAALLLGFSTFLFVACGSSEEEQVTSRGRGGSSSSGRGGSSQAGNGSGGADGSGESGSGPNSAGGETGAGQAGAGSGTGGSVAIGNGGQAGTQGAPPKPSVCEDDISCDDQDPCTQGTCKLEGKEVVIGTCQYAPAADGTACPDDNACTVDACSAGACKHSPAPDGTTCKLPNGTGGVCKNASCETPCSTGCDDGNPCTADACQPSGACGHTPVADGTACTDGDACSSGDACQAGKCKPKVANTCLPPPVDETCAPGCATGTDQVNPAVPLVPHGLPAACDGGFEINNPKKTEAYTIKSKSAQGSAATSLDIQLATYTAPDHVLITGKRKDGTTYKLVDTCTIKTATYADPTMGGCKRPPDDSIRQYKVDLEAGTTSLTFDFAGHCSPTYLRVLGLCEFEVTQFAAGCTFRVIP